LAILSGKRPGGQAMLKRRLGRTNLTVSVLGLGGGGFCRASQDESNRIIAHALAHGVNFIDTAPNYGDSEDKIGIALGAQRKQFFLATKIEELTRDGALRQLDSSLKRLRADCIDVWQWHGILKPEQLDAIMSPGGAIEAMRKAKADKAVRFIGITAHSPWLAMKSLKAAGDLDTVQIPFNVMRRQYGEDPALGLFDYCRRHDIGVIIMKPVAAGRITRNLSTALKFIFAHDIATAIPGAASVAEFAPDVQAAEEFEQLSATERHGLTRDEVLLGQDCCRGCGYCLPCPAGMDVPALLRAEQCARVFGLTEWIREECDRLKVDTSKCAPCGECEKRCPFDVPVRARLEGAKAVFAKRPA